ncbi:heavy-metal-associated domain-containing protein [Plantactinospora sp. S1510]|uniref:Heavy-metal-associated domain-containing protein n=1 Tax=Plantactinospora alkalitolerans TaxID=2789879 RepID=A0ABS0H124_9ACTN|nr:copper ion binding protein [Plantactinospora alkalitolerans]MBF9132156.1 heavy-metal-associated domain-containing protein [Plantactinospora alkalitolerans]
MITKKYEVKGMTCSHCVNAVSTEVGAIPGVTEVAVDLTTGQVTVNSTEPVDVQALRNAVDEAGYELVTP